jgi:hypothetical protein
MFLVSSAFMQTYNPDKIFPVKRLQEDFIELRKLIEENHPALYRYYDEVFFKTILTVSILSSIEK